MHRPFKFEVIHPEGAAGIIRSLSPVRDCSTKRLKADLYFIINTDDTNLSRFLCFFFFFVTRPSPPGPISHKKMAETDGLEAGTP